QLLVSALRLCPAPGIQLPGCRGSDAGILSPVAAAKRDRDRVAHPRPVPGLSPRRPEAFPGQPLAGTPRTKAGRPAGDGVTGGGVLVRSPPSAARRPCDAGGAL